VTGRTGTTPYLRFGDAIPLAVAALVLAVAARAGRRRAAEPSPRRESG